MWYVCLLVSRPLCLVLCAIALAGAGCYHPLQADYVAVRTYRTRESRVATSEAGDARTKLRAAKRLAFQLPDECSTGAGGTDDASRTKLLDLHCGGLAGELEAEALRAGYDVVSWRDLGGASDPVAAAAAAGADLVLRVSESATTVTPATILEPTATTFMAGQVGSASEDRPLKGLGGEARGRCDARFGALAAGPVPAVRVEVDAIVPAERRTVLRLDRVVAEPETASGFWVAQHAEATKPSRHKLEITLGIVGLIGGGMMMTMPALFNEVARATGGDQLGVDFRPLAYTGIGIALGSVIAVLVLPRHLDSLENPEDAVCKSGTAHWRREEAHGERDDAIGRGVAAEVIGRLVGRGPGGAR